MTLDERGYETDVPYVCFPTGVTLSFAWLAKMNNDMPVTKERIQQASLWKELDPKEKARVLKYWDVPDLSIYHGVVA